MDMVRCLDEVLEKIFAQREWITQSNFNEKWKTSTVLHYFNDIKTKNKRFCHIETKNGSRRIQRKTHFLWGQDENSSKWHCAVLNTDERRKQSFANAWRQIRVEAITESKNVIKRGLRTLNPSVPVLDKLEKSKNSLRTLWTLLDWIDCIYISDVVLTAKSVNNNVYANVMRL